MKKYAITTVVFLLLLWLTYFFVFKDCDFNLLLTSLKTVNHFYIFLACLSMFLYVLMGSLFLKKILKYFNKKISWFQAFGYNFTETYFSAITPSVVGGQPLEMLEMKKDGIGYETSGVVVLFNSLFNRIALCFLAIIFFTIFNKDLFVVNTFYNVVVLTSFLFIFFVILVLASLIYSKKVANAILKILTFIINHIKFIKDKQKLITKVSKMIEDYQKCSKITKENPKLIIETFTIMVAQRIFLLLTSYFVYRSFGLNEYSLFLIMAFQICITLGSDIMPTPGGIMINENLLLMVNNIIYGSDLALSGMLLLRSINFYSLVVISLLFYFVFHFRKNLKKCFCKKKVN